MSIFSDIKQSVYDYWISVAIALKNVVELLKEGESPFSSRLDNLFEQMRPKGLNSFKCELCDRVIAEYNKKHKTSMTMVKAEMCYDLNCPGIPICKEEPRKWEVFQCLSCIWYFKEGAFFKDEGNRYPLCERWCKGFTQCEKEVPTDVTNFKELDYEQKEEKLKFCLIWFWDEVAGKNDWGFNILKYILR